MRIDCPMCGEGVSVERGEIRCPMCGYLMGIATPQALQTDYPYPGDEVPEGFNGCFVEVTIAVVVVIVAVLCVLYFNPR